MASETEIQKAGMAYCDDDPRVLSIERTQSGKVKVRGGWMNLCREGTPDTMGVAVDGRGILIEYKTVEAWDEKNHGASKDQLRRLREAYNAGCYAGIACTVGHVDLILKGEPVGLGLKSREKSSDLKFTPV